MPLSVPRHVGQQPVYYNQIRGQHGDRYADLTQEPLFVFGEGLSYSTVEYSDLAVADAARARRRDRPRRGDADQHRRPPGPGDGPGLRQRPGDQRDLGRARSSRPGARSRSPPGESVTVGDRGARRDRARWSTADGRRVVEPGEFELLVGPSSRAGRPARGWLPDRRLRRGVRRPARRRDARLLGSGCCEGQAGRRGPT